MGLNLVYFCPFLTLSPFFKVCQCQCQVKINSKSEDYFHYSCLYDYNIVESQKVKKVLCILELFDHTKMLYDRRKSLQVHRQYLFNLQVIAFNYESNISDVSLLIITSIILLNEKLSF